MAKRTHAGVSGRKKATTGAGTRARRTRSASHASSSARKTTSAGRLKKKGTRPTAAAAKKAVRRTSTARKTASRKPAQKAPARKAVSPGRRAVILSSVRKVPALERVRRIARDEDLLPLPDPPPSPEQTHPAAHQGHRELLERLYDHPEASPALTGGDVDADWAGAYATGDEAPGGDNPTPGQDVVEEIGKALGVRYEDDEELRGVDKISDRDKHRWEQPAKSGDDDA